MLPVSRLRQVAVSLSCGHPDTPLHPDGGHLSCPYPECSPTDYGYTMVMHSDGRLSQEYKRTRDEFGRYTWEPVKR